MAARRAQRAVRSPRPGSDPARLGGSSTSRAGAGLGAVLERLRVGAVAGAEAAAFLRFFVAVGGWAGAGGGFGFPHTMRMPRREGGGGGSGGRRERPVVTPLMFPHRGGITADGGRFVPFGHYSPVHPDGLEGNRAGLDAILRGDSLGRLLGAELLEWGEGGARLRWTPAPAHTNGLGTVHGGAVFALGDIALGVACNSWGRVCVALSLEVHYLNPGMVGRPVLVTAVEHARTRRTGSYRIDVAAEADASERWAGLQAMVYRTEKWHLGADAWSEEWRIRH
jgi:acyl-CoA thioesterase